MPEIIYCPSEQNVKTYALASKQTTLGETQKYIQRNVKSTDNYFSQRNTHYLELNSNQTLTEQNQTNRTKLWAEPNTNPTAIWTESDTTLNPSKRFTSSQKPNWIDLALNLSLIRTWNVSQIHPYGTGRDVRTKLTDKGGFISLHWKLLEYKKTKLPGTELNQEPNNKMGRRVTRLWSWHFLWKLFTFCC